MDIFSTHIYPTKHFPNFQIFNHLTKCSGSSKTSINFFFFRNIKFTTCRLICQIFMCFRNVKQPLYCQHNFDKYSVGHTLRYDLISYLIFFSFFPSTSLATEETIFFFSFFLSSWKIIYPAPEGRKKKFIVSARKEKGIPFLHEKEKRTQAPVTWRRSSIKWGVETSPRLRTLLLLLLLPIFSSSSLFNSRESSVSAASAFPVVCSQSAIQQPDSRMHKSHRRCPNPTRFPADTSYKRASKLGLK